MIRKLIVTLRDWYLVHVKWRKYSFGKNFHAGRNVFLWAKDSIIIGDNCYIGRNSQIECNAKIGNNVLIANNVALVGKYDHNYKEIGTPIRFSSQVQDLDYKWLELNRETLIEDDVWIGYGVIVLSGVVIKKGCIIAAGSTITNDTEEYSIYAGVPAKKISNRFDSENELEQHLDKLKTYKI